MMSPYWTDDGGVSNSVNGSSASGSVVMVTRDRLEGVRPSSGQSLMHEPRARVAMDRYGLGMG